jgi:uncharacterized protein (TIRG00374 family)
MKIPAAKTVIRLVLSLAVSAVFIVFSLRHTDPRAVLGMIASASPWPLIGFFVVQLAIHLVRTVRWKLLLKPVGDVGWRRLNSASAIGFMLLLLLPLRLGELARPMLVSRAGKDGPRLSRSGALASCVVERIIDGIAIGILGIVALRLLATRGSAADFARHASNLVTAIFGLLCLALVFAFFTREQTVAIVRRVFRPISPKLADRVTGMLDAFIRGLHLGSAARVFAVLGLTVVHWMFQVLGFWTIAPAFGLHLTGLQAGTVLAANVVGVMIPAGPGGVGTAQYATQAGLSIFVPGALADTAAAVPAAASAYTIWMLQFSQQVLLGLAFLLAGHVSLAGMFQRSEAEDPPSNQSTSAG